MGTILSICDLTGNMTEPWVAAGHDAILIDPQHGETRKEGRVLRVAERLQDVCWLDDLPREGRNRVVFVAAFPPCTDLATSGVRWWKSKAEKNPDFQKEAAAFALLCARVADSFRCPWFVENPVGALSSIWRKPDYTFQPYQYTAKEPRDNYQKRTCLWTGGGFIMPAPARDWSLGAPDQRILMASPGPDRANFRSATPRGFARAVWQANDIPMFRPRRSGGVF